jgi:hypothetical protein
MLQLREDWLLRQGLPYGQAEQFTQSCGTNSESVEGPASQTSCANYTTIEENPTGEEVLMGTFFLQDRPIIIPFDSGASHDFMSSICAKKAKLSLVAIEAPYVISIPRG